MGIPYMPDPGVLVERVRRIMREYNTNYETALLFEAAVWVDQNRAILQRYSRYLIVHHWLSQYRMGR